MADVLQHPEKLGKYRLLEKISAGGMGEVFLAKGGQEGFERYFAIKRIRSHLEGSENLLEMLMDEARISLALTHPNIAQVIEVGQDAGTFFLVMEYVEALSLSRLLSRASKSGKPLSPPDALAIAIQVCRALGYAHGRTDPTGKPLNIVHRDVSPQNILVDRNGLVKLIDFGIAKAVTSVNATEVGVLKGKIAYMSPEQAEGVPIDHRSDLFAVGVVLFECLAQRSLFGKGTFSERLRRVRGCEIPDLDGVLGSVVAPSTIEVVRRALQRSPAKRYRSAEEMERDLSRALRIRQMEYTPHRLARLVMDLDRDGPARAERMRGYESFTPTEGISVDLPAARTEDNPTRAQMVLPRSLGAGIQGEEAEKSFGDLEIEVAGVVASRSAPNSNRRLLLGVAGVLLLLGGIGFASHHASRDAEGTVDDAGPVEDTSRPPESLPPEVVAQGEPFLPGETSTAPGPGNQPPVVLAPTPTTRPPKRSPRHARGKRPRKTRRPRGGVPVVSEVTKTPRSGCLRVTADPWAYVKVEGRRVGQTPQACVSLPPGRYQVILENPALGISRAHRVKIEAGETTRITEHFP